MRGLIFDYDGLIVDSETLAAEVLIGVLAEHGAEVGLAEVGPFVGYTHTEKAWTEWIGGLIGGEHRVQALTAELWSRIDAKLPGLDARPGVVDLIDAAHEAGWRVGLGTGQGRPRLERGLGRLGLLSRFDAIVTAADVGKGKPAPDIFLEVARQLEVEPRECVVLEDSAPGCAAAVAAGMTAIVCPCDVTAASEFPPEARRVAALTEIRLTEL